MADEVPKPEPPYDYGMLWIGLSIAALIALPIIAGIHSIST